MRRCHPDENPTHAHSPPSLPPRPAHTLMLRDRNVPCSVNLLFLSLISLARTAVSQRKSRTPSPSFIADRVVTFVRTYGRLRRVLSTCSQYLTEKELYREAVRGAGTLSPCRDHFQLLTVSPETARFVFGVFTSFLVESASDTRRHCHSFTDNSPSSL